MYPNAAIDSLTSGELCKRLWNYITHSDDNPICDAVVIPEESDVLLFLAGNMSSEPTCGFTSANELRKSLISKKSSLDRALHNGRAEESKPRVNVKDMEPD